jgi:uncharacterized protein
MKGTIECFEDIGKVNTAETVCLARQRAIELGVTHIVVASTSGFTAREALTVFGEDDVMLTIVGISSDLFDAAVTQKLQSRGHCVLFSTEIDYTYPEIVVNAYRKICEGMKVTVEIASIAVDAGCIATGEMAIAIAGTGTIAFPAGGGADTAIVITPGPSAEHGASYQVPPKPERRRVREIVCMPR